MPKKSVLIAGSLTAFVLIIVVLLFGQGQVNEGISDPESVISSFAGSLDAGRFGDAVVLLVNLEGKPLDDQMKEAYTRHWALALGGEGELVDMSIAIIDKRPLKPEMLSKAGVNEGYDLKVALSGDSRTICLKLPVEGGTMAVVKTQAGWRVLERMQGDFFFGRAQGCV